MYKLLLFYGRISHERKLSEEWRVQNICTIYFEIENLKIYFTSQKNTALVDSN